MGQFSVGVAFSGADGRALAVRVARFEVRPMDVLVPIPFDVVHCYLDPEVRR
jgi:hypothetical protein